MKNKKAALIISVIIITAVFIFFILLLTGVLKQPKLAYISVTYDKDPYNKEMSYPHTYEISDKKDMKFIDEALSSLKRLTGGGDCGYGQIVLHAVYENGRKADYYPAGDSCPAIAKNNPDNCENHFTMPDDMVPEFRKTVSKYIPGLSVDNRWVEALGDMYK